MSCRELERLFVSGAPGAEASAHRRTCAECARIGADADQTRSLVEGLAAPVWSPALRRTLFEIPRQTVSCEGADGLLAAALDEERRLLETIDAYRRVFAGRDPYARLAWWNAGGYLIQFPDHVVRPVAAPPLPVVPVAVPLLAASAPPAGHAPWLPPGPLGPPGGQR